jgi:hypothetical protein
MKRSYFIAAVVVALAASAGVAYATVGGPTYIYDFRYNPADESIYYVSASQGGRGCPPVLNKLSIRSGVEETVFSCEQGEALLAQSAPGHWYPAPLMQKFDELTKNFRRLLPVNLPENGIAIDLDAVQTRHIDGTDFLLATDFSATVFQNGTRVASFPVSGCSKE